MIPCKFKWVRISNSTIIIWIYCTKRFTLEHIPTEDDDHSEIPDLPELVSSDDESEHETEDEMEEIPLPGGNNKIVQNWKNSAKLKK